MKSIARAIIFLMTCFGVATGTSANWAAGVDDRILPWKTSDRDFGSHIDGIEKWSEIRPSAIVPVDHNDPDFSHDHLAGFSKLSVAAADKIIASMIKRSDWTKFFDLKDSNNSTIQVLGSGKNNIEDTIGNRCHFLMSTKGVPILIGYEKIKNEFSRGYNKKEMTPFARGKKMIENRIRQLKMMIELMERTQQRYEQKAQELYKESKKTRDESESRRLRFAGHASLSVALAMERIRASESMTSSEAILFLSWGPNWDRGNLYQRLEATVALQEKIEKMRANFDFNKDEDEIRFGKKVVEYLKTTKESQVKREDQSPVSSAQIKRLATEPSAAKVSSQIEEVIGFSAE